MDRIGLNGGDVQAMQKKQPDAQWFNDEGALRRVIGGFAQWVGHILNGEFAGTSY